VGRAVVSGPFGGAELSYGYAGGRNREQRRRQTGLVFVWTALERPSLAGTCSGAVGERLGAIWCFDGPGSGRFVLVFSDGVVTTVLLAWGIVGPSVAWWAAGRGRWRACLRSPNRPLEGGGA